MILTPIVQLAFRIGNPISALWLSCSGPAVRPASTEDSEMFARKGLFSSIGRTTALATVAALALTAVAPSQATAAGPAKKEGLVAAGASDATDFSARRRAATMIPTVTTAAVPSITAAARLTMAALPIMAAAPITAIAATAPGCPTIRAIPSRVGNHYRKYHSAGRPGRRNFSLSAHMLTRWRLLSIKFEG